MSSNREALLEPVVLHPEETSETRKLDYWWETSNDRPEDHNYHHYIRKIVKKKSGTSLPRLIILGDYTRFLGSALFKAILKGQQFTAVNMSEASDDDLAASNSAFMKWAPRSNYIISEAERSRIPRTKQIINDTHFHCNKDNVQRSFFAVSGYSVAVDPAKYRGPAVMKSTRNGNHDGQIVLLPTTVAKRGVVYERVVDNSIGPSLVYDIRVGFLFGAATHAYIKFRNRYERFENVGTEAFLVSPLDVLSVDEVNLCSKFCAHIGLEYGELDIIRDGRTKELFIIDANNTPAGPPKALTETDKQAVLRLMVLSFCRSVFRLIK